MNIIKPLKKIKNIKNINKISNPAETFDIFNPTVHYEKDVLPTKNLIDTGIDETIKTVEQGGNQLLNILQTPVYLIGGIVIIGGIVMIMNKK